MDKTNWWNFQVCSYPRARQLNDLKSKLTLTSIQKVHDEQNLSPHSLTQQDGHHGHRPEAVLAVVCVFFECTKNKLGTELEFATLKDCLRWSTTCVVSQKIGNGLVCRALTDHLGHA